MQHFETKCCIFYIYLMISGFDGKIPVMAHSIEKNKTIFHARMVIQNKGTLYIMTERKCIK